MTAGETSDTLPCGARGGLGRLSRAQRGLLLAIVLGGALLRIAYQSGRSFAGDEIGTLLFLKEDYAVLLGEFRSWLTMNVYLAGLKALAAVAGNSPWVLVAPSLLASIAVVPLVAAITLRLSSARHALLAAALVAYNPYLVLYSVQIRSYMLLTLFVLLAILWLLDWQHAPGWRGGCKVAAASTAAFLIHPNGFYSVVALAAWLVLLRRLDRPANWTRAQGRALASLLVPSGVMLALAGLVYWPLLDDMAVFRKQWSYTPPTNVAYLPELFENYFGGGYCSLVSLLVLAAGAWRASRENRAVLALALLVGIPMIVASLLGVSHFPWAYARFLIPGLPLLIVFMACAGPTSGNRLAAGVLAGVPFLAWLPAHVKMFEWKRDYPWNTLRAELSAEVGGSDRILAIDGMLKHELSGYDSPYEPRFVSPEGLVQLVPVASELRLIVLSDEPHLVGPEPGRILGNVQVLAYRGQTGAEIALALARDLERMTAGRVESDLTSHYRIAFELYAALRRPEGHTNQILFLKCQSRLHRERQRPVQMP